MKIALIFPNVSILERYGTDIADIGGRQAPLGILYLSSYLKKNGHEVLVIDAATEKLHDENILLKLKKFIPEITGISSTSIALKNTVRLAKKIKDETNSLTVIGGPHISSKPDDFKNMASFDFAIYGEGELPLTNLINSLKKNKTSFEEIHNLLWKTKDGQIVQNCKGSPITNLDTLPFPDRKALKNLSLYRPPLGSYQNEPVVSISTSRGCPYECIFCDNNVFGKKIRFFSPEYVIKEIEEVIFEFNAREIMFVDDTFPCSKKRFIKILEGMIEKKIGIKWSCMANVNDLDEEVVKLMKTAGCWQIAIGIESGDDEILKKIKKKTNTEKIAKIANIINQKGIFIKGFFMMGHPGETEKTMEKTRIFALSLPLSDVTCTLATPISGSEFYEMAQSGVYGKFDSNTNTSKLNYWEPVFLPKGLDSQTILRAQKKFFLSFYLRPTIVIIQIKKIKTITVLFRFIKTIFKIIFF
jgi:radical SAM superfamily enzyme YgiQ (UPF0313 family)